MADEYAPGVLEPTEQFPVDQVVPRDTLRRLTRYAHRAARFTGRSGGAGL